MSSSLAISQHVKELVVLNDLVGHHSQKRNVQF